MSSSQPRSVKISDNERGGWSSDRPRRAGGGKRPPQLLPDEEWPSLRGLGAYLGVGSPTLPVAG